MFFESESVIYMYTQILYSWNESDGSIDTEVNTIDAKLLKYVPWTKDNNLSFIVIELQIESIHPSSNLIKADMKLSWQNFRLWLRAERFCYPEVIIIAHDVENELLYNGINGANV